MNFELEELQLDEELETVERSISRYAFPVVSVHGHQMFFNMHFSKLVAGIEYIRISTSPNYVVFQPAKSLSPSSFKLGKPTNYNGRACVIPAALKEKKIAHGVYKIYKFNDGWAFKRYEPLEVKE